MGALFSGPHGQSVHGASPRRPRAPVHGGCPPERFLPPGFLSFSGGCGRHPAARPDGRRDPALGSDYPHAESTFPRSRAIVDRICRGCRRQSRPRSQGAIPPGCIISARARRRRARRARVGSAPWGQRREPTYAFPSQHGSRGLGAALPGRPRPARRSLRGRRCRRRPGRRRSSHNQPTITIPHQRPCCSSSWSRSARRGTTTSRSFPRSNWGACATRWSRRCSAPSRSPSSRPRSCRSSCPRSCSWISLFCGPSRRR